MEHSLGFQERWEFRRKEINEDSSSDDDSKSNSEQTLKNQRLIVEDDYHSDNPTQIETEVGNQRTKGKSKCKKPKNKQQTRVTKRKKLASQKIEHVAVKKPKRKKNNGFAYDPSLMEDFKSFSESLLEDMKVTGENLFVKMREEIFEFISNGPSKPNHRSMRMGCAHVQNQRKLRYNQMPSGQENIQSQGRWEMNRNEFFVNNLNQPPLGENANAVCDFPQVQHLKGFWLDRGLPNTSLNRPFLISGGSEGPESINAQHNHNLDLWGYLSGSVANSMSSGRADRNLQDAIRQNSLNSFNLGMLPRNGARDQLLTWRAKYGLEIPEVEHIKNFKPDVPYMKDDARQLQATVDERVAFHGNFCTPIMLRERDYEQSGRLLSHPKFTTNASTPVASSMYLAFPEGTPNLCVKSHFTNTPNFIQQITPGNHQRLMNREFQRMSADGSNQSGAPWMEQNLTSYHNSRW